VGQACRFSNYIFWVVAFHHVFSGELQAEPVSFVSATSFRTDEGPVSLAVGDFNRDGNQDLVTANDPSNSVTVLLGSGNGSFQTPINLPAGIRPQGVVVSYLNGDDLQDLAVANFDGNVSVLLGNGNGTFRPAMSFPAGAGASSLVDGDFDGDRLQDLAVTTGNSVTVLLGNGNGTPWTPLVTPFPV
jgi:FG-GAP-like repeat/FG-GAP repeat